MKKAEFQRLAKECAKFASEFDEENLVVLSTVCRSNMRSAIYSYSGMEEELDLNIYIDDDYNQSDKAMELFFEKCKNMVPDKEEQAESMSEVYPERP